MTRIQIEMADDKLSHLEQLMEKCGIRTKKEFINNALALLEWAIEEKEKGNILASVDEDQDRYKEVCLPGLSHVRSRSKAHKAAMIH